MPSITISATNAQAQKILGMLVGTPYEGDVKAYLIDKLKADYREWKQNTDEAAAKAAVAAPEELVVT